MAIAVEELTPEVAGEYSRLTSAGVAPGKTALDRAKSNVLAAGGPTKPSSQGSAGRSAGPSRSRTRYGVDPSSGSLWTGRAAGRLLPTSISGRSSILPRLITAGFLGLLVLEAVSYVTGQYFNWHLTTPLAPPSGLQYRPLYNGQQVGQPPTSNPHLDPAQQLAGSPLPIGNRSAGNLGVS